MTTLEEKPFYQIFFFEGFFHGHEQMMNEILEFQEI